MSASATTVEERCGCGASIRVTSTVVGSTLTRWRDEHHCSLPPKPGPCFVVAPAIWPSGITPRCELRAGHEGAPECALGLMGASAAWTDRDDAEMPAQDAQDGAVGPGSVRMGTGEGAAPDGAQIEDFEGER